MYAAVSIGAKYLGGSAKRPIKTLKNNQTINCLGGAKSHQLRASNFCKIIIDDMEVSMVSKIGKRSFLSLFNTI